MKKILDEFNLTNSTNDKLDVMRKYKNNQMVIEVFQKALDKVIWTYGISLKNIPEYTPKGSQPLSWALKGIEKLARRDITGNAAIDFLTLTLESLSDDDAYVIERIIDRDLKINFGKTGFNKIVDKKDKITRPPYMRCGIYTEKTSKKITFPALVQLKADGSFCTVTVDQGQVTFNSRSGEEREFPHLKEQFARLWCGVYIGELLVKGITNRALANGVLNSDNSKDQVYIQLWDYVSLDEYSRGKDKSNKTQYIIRWEQLTKNIGSLLEDTPEFKQGGSDIINIIPSVPVDNIREALEQTSKWMNQGFEGAILKDFSNIFVDHTSPTQLKLKLEIDAEVRVTGFTEGKPGTKRTKTFGAMVFENDEGTIKGQTSGFTDAQLLDFNQRREELIGKVITVQFNDITKARDNDYYALSHPRFVEFRNDKNTTDTLERVQNSKEMAMTLGEVK